MWKKILGGLVIFIVLVVGLALWATSGLTDTATAFFNKVKAHDYKTAYYGYLSDDFKGNVPLEKFKAFMEANRMDRFKEIKWGNREAENGKGKLEGTLIMPDGSSIPIVVDLVKGEESWKIYAVSKPAAGLKETPSDTRPQKSAGGSVPPKEEYIRLARRTVAQVAESLRTRNTRPLYDSISETWKRQISPEKFQEIFSGMMKSGIDLTPLEQVSPKEVKPAFLDKDNLLNVRIYYPSRPVDIAFDLDYINEGGTWKLLGINIHGKQPEQ